MKRHCKISEVSNDEMLIHHMKSYKQNKEGSMSLDKMFSQNLNVTGQKKCYEIVTCEFPSFA